MSPIMPILLSRYSKQTQVVPVIMAIGMVFPGFFMDPAGVVAVSRPIKPHNASRLTLLSILDVLKLAAFAVMVKLCVLNRNNAARGINSKGINLSSVSINSALPAACTPFKLSRVTAKSKANSSIMVMGVDCAPIKGRR